MTLPPDTVRLVGRIVSLSVTGEERAVLLVRIEQLRGGEVPAARLATLPARGPVVRALAMGKPGECRIEAVGRLEAGTARVATSIRVEPERITVLEPGSGGSEG